MLHSPNGLNSQDWSRGSIQAPQWEAKTPSTKAVFSPVLPHWQEAEPKAPYLGRTPFWDASLTSGGLTCRATLLGPTIKARLRNGHHPLST